ncbi:MAG TPA: hypothetical protein VK213_14350 [Bacteroidales bacterium]|nr:hypothetical protein [Bacteroidales bacterium]
MRRLPEEFVRNGFRYNLVRRAENKAIYSQTFRNIVVGYEVFKIRIMRARFNKVFEVDEPDQERYPCNEDFGRHKAWSTFTLEEALAWYQEL